MIFIISIIILTIGVFGLTLFKTNRALIAFIVSGVFSVLATIGMIFLGNYTLNNADTVEGRTEVALTAIDENNNYIIYDRVKGVYYYKEQVGGLLKEVKSEDAKVTEEKRGKTRNTAVRERVSISNKLLRTLYKGSVFESKIIVEFKIEDGGLTIQ